MRQTEGICPACGYAYRDVEDNWRDQLLQNTSLRDHFLITAVVACPFALWHYFAPIVLGNDAPQASGRATGFFVFSLGICFYFSSHVLGKKAPLLAKLFAAMGIATLALWPLWL